ncbi:hypothetical protein Gohar_011055, partial [Gossypium harknessii]|nr:hypothetical protein [Gossypium harknessii]
MRKSADLTKKIMLRVDLCSLLSMYTSFFVLWRSSRALPKIEPKFILQAGKSYLNPTMPGISCVIVGWLTLKSFSKGYVTEKSQLAFSQPSSDGQALASNYI